MSELSEGETKVAARLSGLDTFLLARYDEVERIARGAGGTWREDGETGEIFCSDGRVAENLISARIAGLAEHITLHDPQAVLGDIAAKRQIVKQSTWVNLDEHRDFSDFMAGRAQEARSVLRLLALPFADHPDYDESWRP